MIRICMYLHLYSCSGPTNNSNSTVSMSFWSKLILRAGLFQGGLRFCLRKKSCYLPLSHSLVQAVEVEKGKFRSQPVFSSYTASSVLRMKEELICNSQRLPTPGLENRVCLESFPCIGPHMVATWSNSEESWEKGYKQEFIWKKRVKSLVGYRKY